MNEEVRTLVDYRLARAREALEEAELLLREGHTNAYVNRLYYAAFYASSAVLLSRGLSSSKHTGIRALFHRTLVRTGDVAPELGRLYETLFDNRLKGDYADLVRFQSAEVEPWLKATTRLVEHLEALSKVS